MLAHSPEYLNKTVAFWVSPANVAQSLQFGQVATADTESVETFATMPM